MLALAAVAWLAWASGSPGRVQVPSIPPAAARAGAPPAPPHGALVLARAHGALAVALAARRSVGGARLTATVVTPGGSGLSGLDVRFALAGRSFAAAACGPGCYAAVVPGPVRTRRVAIELSGPGRPRSAVAFALPARWPVPAANLLRGAERAFAALHSVVYRERLASGPRVVNTSLWRSEAPDRLSYRTASGDAGVVIGRTRWDLVVGGGWQRGLQNPPLALPAPPWGGGAYDAMLLGEGRLGARPVVRLSMFEPSTPAWYTVTLDRATLRALEVRMTAAAHFMQDRYVAFDVPRQIRPPGGGSAAPG